VICAGLDKDRYLHPDAYYQPLVPAVPRIIGSIAIVAEIQRQLSVYKDPHAEIHLLMASDTAVFTERTDHVSYPEWGASVWPTFHFQRSSLKSRV
jgi:limonene-1,2-epoxide hydrolase